MSVWGNWLVGYIPFIETQTWPLPLLCFMPSGTCDKAAGHLSDLQCPAKSGSASWIIFWPLSAFSWAVDHSADIQSPPLLQNIAAYRSLFNDFSTPLQVSPLSLFFTFRKFYSIPRVGKIPRRSGSYLLAALAWRIPWTGTQSRTPLSNFQFHSSVQVPAKMRLPKRNAA